MVNISFEISFLDKGEEGSLDLFATRPVHANASSMDPNRLRTASFGSDRLDIYNRLEEDRKGSVRSYLSPLLLSHPEDDISDYDLDSPRLVGGSDYVRQNLRMVSNV